MPRMIRNLIPAAGPLAVGARRDAEMPDAIAAPGEMLVAKVDAEGLQNYDQG